MTSSMDTTLSAIDSYYPDASKASNKVIEENSGTMTALMTTFEDAKLNGQLDKTLASETAGSLIITVDKAMTTATSTEPATYKGFIYLSVSHFAMER